MLRIELSGLPEGVLVTAGSTTTTCVAFSCEVDVPFTALTANKKITVSVALAGKSPSTKEFESPTTDIDVALFGGGEPGSNRAFKKVECELTLTGTKPEMARLHAGFEVEDDGTPVLTTSGSSKLDVAGLALQGPPKGTHSARMPLPQQLPFLHLSGGTNLQLTLPAKASSPDNSAEGRSSEPECTS
ncbi:MAG: hypothetical protein U0414_36690 [Polyangiaceae bacterium]